MAENLSAFLKQNVDVVNETEYVASKRIKVNGEPVAWKIKTLATDETEKCVRNTLNVLLTASHVNLKNDSMRLHTTKMCYLRQSLTLIFMMRNFKIAGALLNQLSSKSNAHTR